MRDDCSDFKTWEEKIYWTHFQSVQFSQILSGCYHHQLSIPKKFTTNLGRKLGKEVSLKVPSGAMWSVGLEMDRDSFCFKSGWKEFVRDNSLEENDILIFKYNGSSEFDVLLFDGQSLCEKESSYFVRKCGHTNMPRESRRKEKETLKETGERTPQGHQRPSNDVLEQVEESLQPRSEQSVDDAEWTPSKKSRKYDAAFPNSLSRHRRAKGKIQGRKSTLTPEVRGRPLEIFSNRRAVTQEEKLNAERMANIGLPGDSVVVVMREHQVYRDFLLTIPAWWVNEHLPPKSHDVILQANGRSWRVTFMKRSTGGMLTTGWKKFALDNVLEEFDACLFRLSRGRSNPVTIDVSIFRVVEEVVPPSPAPTTTSRPRGRPLKIF